jgi:hypothetical protein
MYFEGEKLNETDTVLGELPGEERAQFIIHPGAGENGLPLFLFNLTLKKATTHTERLAALDACTGRYDFLEPGKAPQVFVIRREDSQLFLEIVGYTSVELKNAGKDEYKTDALYYRVVFNRHSDGSVDSMTVHNSSKFETMPTVVAPKVG